MSKDNNSAIFERLSVYTVLYYNKLDPQCFQ